MAFRLPTFQVPVSIWHFGTPLSDPADAETIGNLTPGRRFYGADVSNVPAVDSPAPQIYLLFPMGVVLLGDYNTGGTPDTVEVATGDGWFYLVHYVDRVARGFANEHQFAVLNLIRGAGPMPSGSILLEDGTAILLEDGTDLLLE